MSVFIAAHEQVHDAMCHLLRPLHLMQMVMLAIWRGHGYSRGVNNPELARSSEGCAFQFRRTLTIALSAAGGQRCGGGRRRDSGNASACLVGV